MMCAGQGFTSTRQIAGFWRACREDFARIFKDFPIRDISHDTVRNFYIALGKCNINLLLEQFNAMLLLEAGVCEDIRKNASPEERAAFQRSVLALDGQAIRASKITVGKDRAKCCLSVFDTSFSVVQAQELVGEKTNEIPHATQLIRKIDIKHAIITADAMHTQVELLGCIIEAEADYCMAVKGNQPSTQRDIHKAFDAPKNEHLLKTLTQYDKGHGRYETRVINVLPSSVLEPETVEKWPGLENGSIAQVVSTRLEDATDKKSVETRYFISSLSYDLDWIAPWLLYIIRRHWCIENKALSVNNLPNADTAECSSCDIYFEKFPSYLRMVPKLHWVLDVTYGQDYIQCKNDDYLRGVTTLNKVMYNFTSAAQALLSKEQGEKVSMRSLKPYFCSVTSILKLISKVCVGANRQIDGT